jgi:hypothetical protein
MIYLEAPNSPDVTEFARRDSLFLAGGITGCTPWQFDFANRFQDTELFVVNPRRKEWPENVGKDSPVARDQIAWEHFWISKVTAMSFWFTPDTIQPITLFELGKSVMMKKVFLGIHPDYERRFDLVEQMELEEPCLQIVSTLDELEEQIREYFK